MKLIKSRFTIDEDTFAPVVELTIQIELEVVDENKNPTGDEFYKMIGKEFVESILKS